MCSPHLRRVFTAILAILLTFSVATPLAWGQHGSEGRVNVTVVDPSGAVVSGAELSLVDLSTNDARTVKTNDSGTFTFVNLDIGTYKLTVSMTGFASQTVDRVVVQAAKSTDITVHLLVGAQAQSVQVEAAAPVLETTTNAIGQVIDPKSIENLPIGGRDVAQLSRTVAGYNGTWNGLPAYAQGNNVDGVIGSPSRMKFGGNSGSSVATRLENIEEMAIQTDSLDLNQGFGQASMQINYVTRRGTNSWHGRLYEDLRNDDLNANSWSNNARGVKRAEFKRNEFGGSVGGPILRDKLFFFFSLSAHRQPGQATQTSNVLVAAAQAGNYTYVGTDGATHTVNVFNAAKNFNASLPSTVNSAIGAQLTKVNGVVSAGQLSTTTNPNVQTLTFLTPAPFNGLYPTFRVDYNPTQKLRMNLAFNNTRTDQPAAVLPFFPGDLGADTQGSNKVNNYTASYALDYTFSPTLINQLKIGYLYNTIFRTYNSPKNYVKNPQTVAWNFPTSTSNTLRSPMSYTLPITEYYPVFNISDSVSWQKGSHSFAFGFSGYREQDHYWNPPEGISAVTLSLASGDPAQTALTDAGGYQPLPAASQAQQTEAQNLYALLTGRISSVFGRNTYVPSSNSYTHDVTAFNLDERQQAWGLFVQDSWRWRPTVTVNYGLRWDFTGDAYDLQNAYHNADKASIFGPSGVNNLFTPGSLKGTNTPTFQARPHPYNSWNVSPQPAVGIAWSPRHNGGVLGSILGTDATVIRAGFSLRRFTIPYQYFWDNASANGSFFYQFFNLAANNTGALGTFAPGVLSLGQTFPAFSLAPATYQATAPVSQFTFVGGSPPVKGFDSNIRQPYTESWNLGIQRSLGRSRVLELRYNGNRTIHQWLNLNVNEVNIFENGFLKEFINAQNNLRINGGSSFGNLNPAAGTVPLPILTAAFTGSTANLTGTSQTNAQFRNSTFITQLQTGQAGAMARNLSTVGAANYLCNLTGPGFAPCATNVPSFGPNGVGAGFPINFFQANPYAAGNSAEIMTDAAYSSYNGLQVDFRQGAWHGLQFDANYTWSKTLGIGSYGQGGSTDWQGNYNGFTLRDLRQSYLPEAWDAHHVVHFTGSYDLPLGKGKRWANSGGVVDRIVGGWNIGSLMTIQSGYPFMPLSGYSTFNNIADSGVILNGVTRQQLQNSVGAHMLQGTSFSNPTRISLIDPKYLSISSTNPTSVTSANQSLITPNTTPGTFQAPLVLWGPHGFYQDAAISKAFSITERWKFNLQGEFLNVWNHPVFGNQINTGAFTGNVRSSGWGTTTGSVSTARQVEVRANIIF